MNRLPEDCYLDKTVLKTAIKTTKLKTESRYKLIYYLRKFCSFCGFTDTAILDEYATGKAIRKSRTIPNDIQIIQAFESIGHQLSPRAPKNSRTPEQWQWLYGMMTAYRLRDHEVFAIDLDAYLHPSNTYHLLELKPEVIGGTKTGTRNCPIAPLHPEWVELFDLKNPKPIILTGKLNIAVKDISDKFRRCQIGFIPYCLRHAYAIRGHRLRVPPKTMADYMRHSMEEHVKTYQKWMDKDVNFEIYKEVVIDKLAITKEDFKARIVELEAENISLRAENETLKMLLTEYKLDNLLNR